jgi:DNA polymerase-3 subunit alpha
MNAPDFHVHSTFSTLDGMGTPLAVVERAKALGWGAVSLTEHGWMGSAPVLYKAARENGIKPIIGCELYVVPNEILGVKSKDTRSASFHLTVLALSAEGYHNLVAWTTFASQPENFYYRPRISLDAMAEIAPFPLHHNIILSGCMGGELCSSLASTNGDGHSPEPFIAYIDSVKSLFTNFYIELQAHRHPKFMDRGFDFYEKMVADEDRVRSMLISLGYQTNTPMILTNDSHFQTTQQRTAHLMMTAQKRGDNRMTAGDYMPQYGYFTNYMQSLEKIAERTSGLPDDALSNAIAIAEESNIVLDPLDNFSYSIPFSGYDDPIAKIRKRATKRLKAAVKKHGEIAQTRFDHELDTMGDFAHYLLIMSDFIRYAKKQGILTNTRGSAANSFLAYCIGIHDLDSIEYDLLFSRFVNPARPSLPDIDIDIQKGRFDDFMSYVKDYMAEREGEGQVVQICNYGTLANRATFRMIADALGMPKEEQDEIAKLLPQMIDSGMVDEESDVYEALKEDYPEIYEMATKVFDSIKNISQHACGWLFGTKDRPISQWVPLTLIASSGSLVTQYNMKILEDMGLNKGDFLRLRTLDVIQGTRKLLGHDALDITDIPLDDPATFEMLRDGRTEGVFTLQGKENRRGCIEVEVENVHDVIRTVAIYRPALTREGKHTLYNNRRKGLEHVRFEHEILKDVLGPTHGVPIFQEQVMEICYRVGMSDAEVYKVYKAIKLAKGVGRGAKEAFAEIKPIFFAACKASKIKKDAREALWNEVVGSQGYGFNKGHASSYGVLATRAAYLKANHPAEFFTSLLDVYPEKAKYVAAARAEGFKFAPPDVNSSGGGFTLDRSTGEIRVGLRKVAGLGPVAVNEILASQPFNSLDDFRERTTRRALNKTRMETLAELGALESLGIKKTADDTREYEILGFTLAKPKAFRGIKPKHVGARVSDRGWHHLGLERGAEITEGRASVSKLFWIPEIEDSKHHKTLDAKASPWAQVKTYLLLAIDENGLPFHIMANEDKEGEVRILRAIADNFRGGVICMEGGVRQPFLTDGPMGFRFYGISGADFQNDPQIWIGKERLTDIAPKKARGVVGLHEIKRQLRRAA